MCFTTITQNQNYLQMPTYRRIHGKMKCAPILRSYDYVKLNQLQTTTRSHHTLLQTHAITRMKMFFFQPICQGIRFRSACNLCQKILYEQDLSQTIPLPEGSVRQYTVLNNPTIIHTNNVFAPACHLRKKISPKTKLSYYSLLHPHALHT